MRLIFTLFFAAAVITAGAADKDFGKIPHSWKWIDSKEVVFTYDGTYTDEDAFSVDARSGKWRIGVKAPEKYPGYPVNPQGAVNLTFSPDSSRLAYTRDNDLYVMDIDTEKETRLTFDGSDLILNGYASWVYYEEIFGRPSKYRAFWWSPDSRKIGFYRFDNSQVPLFPIYSHASDSAGAASQSQSPKVTDLGPGGSLKETRYPKAGQINPQVRIGIIDLDSESLEPVWADFNPEDDQYFGTPFWGPDSREFFISRMPRLQNTLDLYSVNVCDGSRKHIYHETYDTWIDWISSVVFTEKGLYMARNFETGWQQIYFLSYDGKSFRRLTDGTNWSVSVLRVDEKKGDVYFTAKRDASARAALYKVARDGKIYALTDPAYNVERVRFSPDGRYFAAAYSNFTTPARVAVFKTSGGVLSSGHGGDIASANVAKPSGCIDGMVVADMKTAGTDMSGFSLPEFVHITTPDGFCLPGMIQYPAGFDTSRKYPVHVDIYGGPDTPLVRDRWITPTDANQWYSRNGIIQITVDPRAGGHNGRAGLDMIYRNLTVNEVKDFISWAEWLQSLPYVDGEKIGVEGFSFGGTMTCMLLMQASDCYHYGIAGGGVYDWALYDSHYTERYMDTPQNNPEGYAGGCVLNYVEGYPVSYFQGSESGSASGSASGSESACESGSESACASGSESACALGNASGSASECGAGGRDSHRSECAEAAKAVAPKMLKLTHGTGDDNVHFQNTLQLLDAMHRCGRKFEFMIYPDGMHGYRGYQGTHFEADNHEFWLRYLCR